MKIYVLMAVYNGEKYLNEAIDSILSQSLPSDVLVKLIVSDDASTDDSKLLLQKYDASLELLDCERKGGAVSNFKYLIDNCPLDGDLYFFADQDDVWMADKIDSFISKYRYLIASRHANDMNPIMVFSDLSVVDERLNIIHQSMFKSCHHNPNPTFSELMVQNSITGCAMAVNQKAIRLAREMDFQHVVMHDWILGLICKVQGYVGYIDYPTVMYRQHENNVVGAASRKCGYLFFKPWELLSFLKHCATRWQSGMRQLDAFNKYLQRLGVPIPVVLHELLLSLSSGVLSRLKCFLFMGVRKFGIKRNVVFFLIYVLHLFVDKDIEDKKL